MTSAKRRSTRPMARSPSCARSSALELTPLLEGRWLRILRRDERRGARELAPAHRAPARRRAGARRAAWRACSRCAGGCSRRARGSWRASTRWASVRSRVRSWRPPWCCPRASICPGSTTRSSSRASEREALDAEIRRQALAGRVAELSLDEVDRLNVLRASLEAMRLAVVGARPWRPITCSSTRARSPRSLRPRPRSSKATRATARSRPPRSWPRCTATRCMRELDARYPGYGFARHKGYSTREHFARARAPRARAPSTGAPSRRSPSSRCSRDPAPQLRPRTSSSTSSRSTRRRATGAHTFVRVEKRLRTTEEVARDLARAAGVRAQRRRLCGAQGPRRGRDAVVLGARASPPTRRSRSRCPARACSRRRATRTSSAPATCAGTASRSRLRGVDAAARARAPRARLAEITARGLPNRFGAQRFGRDGRQRGARARRFCAGELARARPPRRALPAVGAGRPRYSTPRSRRAALRSTRSSQGDLAMRHDSGGVFLRRGPGARAAARARVRDQRDRARCSARA